MNKVISLFLSVVMGLMAFTSLAYADSSTTTQKSVYKDISANTQIYIAADSGYRYYGAKAEPSKGVLYGRVVEGGMKAGGGWGCVNADLMADESICAFYWSVGDTVNLKDYAYLFEPVISDGQHALLINVNFSREAADCKAVMTDAGMEQRLTAAFQYLNTLSCPVLVRIGGEMNLWSNLSAADYKAAYVKIASILRQHAPNAAAVFSPNFTAAKGVDMDSFYPGDSYVDWVGTSLYYNRYANNGDTRWPEFYGVNQYGDALLSVQQTVNLSKLHNKPVIVTEGGSAYTCNGSDCTAFAAERVEKAMALLPVVYPQIKAIVYSDTNFGSTTKLYSLYNNPTMEAAFEKGVKANPTLLHDFYGAASAAVPLSSYQDALTGNVSLTAYTYSSDRQTANWYIDGKWMTNTSAYPYTYSFNADALSAGTHTVKVLFTNGASKEYTVKVNAKTATISNNSLYVDGVSVSPAIYKIDGSNYFKLRDVAYLLNGSGRQFSVDYDNNTKQINLLAEKAYEPDGSELKTAEGSKEVTALKSNNALLINGGAVTLQAYKINGNNYFKLRDLGQALDFFVGYDDKTKSVTVSGSKGYEK